MLLFLLPIAVAQNAPGTHSAPSERSFQRTVDLVQGLYLYPEKVDVGRMLHGGADSLSNALHWLLVGGEGRTVDLRHGDGTLIGTVSVANLETLPSALVSIETLVRSSGYPLDDVDVQLELLEGITDALDPYSRVLAGDGLDRFDVRLKGTLVGVGLTVSLRDERLFITKVNDEGPALRAGVQVGDEIVRIDGKSTVNMPTSEATRRMRGEADTSVTLTLLREGVERVVSLQRAEVVVPNVESRVLEGGVGYLEISHVSQRTVENLRGELIRLRTQGALSKGLVLDLRGNTGGSMKESARAVDEFVDAGLLLRTAGPDGNQVRNLQSRMVAEEGGEIPPIPVAVLIDERTASGAEIMAGALLELERAGLVGTRSYGKGTVQKIYPLSEDVRLKLTVAQYLLANDRVIADLGLVPDVLVGGIELDSYGVHYQDWDEERNRTSVDQVVPWVLESWAWRQQDQPTLDVVEEIGRRAVLQAVGPSRESMLVALKATSIDVRREQEAHLVEALAAQGIDWGLPEVPVSGPLPAVEVKIDSRPDPEREHVIVLHATVKNNGTTPLHRVRVELDSEFRIWDGLVIPIGRLEPGAALEGEVRVGLAAGVNLREDDVEVAVHAASYGRKVVDRIALAAESTAKPQLTAKVNLVGEGPIRRAQVELRNPSAVRVEGLEVHFAHPGDLDMELIDRAARVPAIDPAGSHSFELELALGPRAPTALPLQLVIETSTYGDLGKWPVTVPLDGTPVSLQKPVIQAPRRPLNAPEGPLSIPFVVTDERTLDHVVVFHNGAKVAWAPGAPRVEVVAQVDLVPGRNRFVVVGVDDQGLEEREQFVVRGVASDDAIATPGTGG